jgi:hypothetical protein
MVYENPLDLFFAAFTAIVASLIYFHVISLIPDSILVVIVVLMFISAFFDIVA